MNIIKKDMSKNIDVYFKANRKYDKISYLQFFKLKNIQFSRKII
jgi:hypothetical protein